MSNVIKTKSIQTMSSVELVEVINELREEGKAELRHDNFMVKIENHPGIQSPKFLGDYKDSKGRTYKCYHLPKREAELMVMSESLEVQTRVYDRMNELEQKLIAPTTEPAKSLDAHAAFKMMPMIVRAAKSLGLDKNSAAISANQAVLKITGTNVLLLLGQTHMESEKQELVFNVSDLVDGISGVKMNKMLLAAGMQTSGDGRWIITEAGKNHCRIFDTGKRHNNGTPIQQIKWFKTVLDHLSSAEVD